MLRRCVALRNAYMTRATRLQLGNVKSPHGDLQTAAGNHEKWGYLYRGWRYPVAGHLAGSLAILVFQVVVGVWAQYRDMILLSEHITYEDVKDRCLTQMPGWARLQCFNKFTAGGMMPYRDPTPLDWLPLELKLGQVKQASY
uniref:Uncharacterized protein n=1 Tax=Neobodo designis TaxID=312471 RepID=A0A7S1L3G4_NEODS|mmetsp:Transcript_13761/g.42842  ORF Transcript_13761/g.42842 Transcript_13761/m.42842 type:complete len:142 (+) Transcript_13761:145-570(+)